MDILCYVFRVKTRPGSTGRRDLVLVGPQPQARSAAGVPKDCRIPDNPAGHDLSSDCETDKDQVTRAAFGAGTRA